MGGAGLCTTKCEYPSCEAFARLLRLCQMLKYSGHRGTLEEGLHCCGNQSIRSFQIYGKYETAGRNQTDGMGWFSRSYLHRRDCSMRLSRSHLGIGMWEFHRMSPVGQFWFRCSETEILAVCNPGKYSVLPWRNRARWYVFVFSASGFDVFQDSWQLTVE